MDIRELMRIRQEVIEVSWAMRDELPWPEGRGFVWKLKKSPIWWLMDVFV